MKARCKECEARWQRAHYERTKEIRLAQSAAWYSANRARKNETSRRYYVEHAEQIAEARARWFDQNPGYMAEYMRRRRATVRGVTVGEVDLDALWTGSCGICGDLLDPNTAHPDPMSKSIDHIVPISRGGAHEQSNLQWAHLICNIRKGARVAPSQGEEVA